MSHKELELISALAAGFRGDQLALIGACVRGMELPISVRCLAFGGVAANESYLDMLRRTHKEFTERPLISVVPPCDIASGLGQQWVQTLGGLVQAGSGSMHVRLWDGSDIMTGRLDTIRVGSWAVTAFKPCRYALLRVVPPAQSLELPLFQ